MPIFCCCHQWRLTISSGDKIPNWTLLTVRTGAFESDDIVEHTDHFRMTIYTRYSPFSPRLHLPTNEYSEARYRLLFCTFSDQLYIFSLHGVVKYRLIKEYTLLFLFFLSFSEICKQLKFSKCANELDRSSR